MILRVNRAVFAEAEAAGILINAVDDPPFCDFYFPSVVRRGDLQIAISTAAQAPRWRNGCARRSTRCCRSTLGEWLAELGNLRREILQREPANDARRGFCISLPAATSAASMAALPARWPAATPKAIPSSPTQSPRRTSRNHEDIGAIGRGLSGRRGAGRRGAADAARAAADRNRGCDPAHRRLVSDEVLALAPRLRHWACPVGKRCGQPRITQAGIHALMLEHAHAGRSRGAAEVG